jgi:hypothetical protein
MHQTLDQRVKRALTAGVVAAVIVPVMPTEAFAAADKKPPKSYLRDDDGRLQKGRLGSYCWISDGKGVCVDTLPTWPKAKRVDAGEKLRIRLRKRQKPDLSLRAYKKVKNNGIPKGDGRPLRRKLRRVKRGGDTIGWKAIIHLARRGRHYYIGASAAWGEGDAFYAFHVRTRD